MSLDEWGADDDVFQTEYVQYENLMIKFFSLLFGGVSLFWGGAGVVWATL